MVNSAQSSFISQESVYPLDRHVLGKVTFFSHRFNTFAIKSSLQRYLAETTISFDVAICDENIIFIFLPSTFFLFSFPLLFLSRKTTIIIFFLSFFFFNIQQRLCQKLMDIILTGRCRTA